MTANLPPVAWHISTYSDGGTGNCVEAGPLLDGSGRIAVRHSKRPDAEVIVYTRAEWDAFLAGTKSGEFDFPQLTPEDVAPVLIYTASGGQVMSGQAGRRAWS